MFSSKFVKVVFATLALSSLALGVLADASPDVAAPKGTATQYVPGPFPTARPQTALKADAADAEAAADGIGELLMCVNANFGAPCTNVLYFENTCTNVPTNFQDDVSAVQPSAGVVCTLYIDLNCGGGFIISINPGYANLAQQGFNDKITSFVCT